MRYDLMLDQLTEEKHRIQVELQKIENAIQSVTELKQEQLDRGIVDVGGDSYPSLRVG